MSWASKIYKQQSAASEVSLRFGTTAKVKKKGRVYGSRPKGGIQRKCKFCGNSCKRGRKTCVVCLKARYKNGFKKKHKSRRALMAKVSGQQDRSFLSGLKRPLLPQAEGAWSDAKIPAREKTPGNHALSIAVEVGDSPQGTPPALTTSAQETRAQA